MPRLCLIAQVVVCSDSSRTPVWVIMIKCFKSELKDTLCRTQSTWNFNYQFIKQRLALSILFFATCRALPTFNFTCSIPYNNLYKSPKWNHKRIKHCSKGPLSFSLSSDNRTTHFHSEPIEPQAWIRDWSIFFFRTLNNGQTRKPVWAPLAKAST